MRIQYIRPLFSIMAAFAAALCVMGFTGSDGKYDQEKGHAKCTTYMTFYRECETSWRLGQLDLCAGTCQSYKFDRSCGHCITRYGGSCAVYTGRVAVVSETQKRDCVANNIMGLFPSCTCPALGSFTPVGLMVCGCADPASWF